MITIPITYIRTDAVKIVRWVGNNQQRFGELMEMFFAADERTALRCIWIISMCTEENPAVIRPWLPKLIKLAGKKDVHESVKRNIIRTLQFVEIPRSLQGTVANICFDALQDLKAPVSIKAFSMSVLANIATFEPDLKQEISLVVEQMLPYGSAGVQSRAKKVLKQLAK
ncbi:MAG: hypothetical protein WCX28_09355 [Bacteriovoracaceae bacterium]|nr:hypothetical protein [Bacteroidota bacterium]